MISVIMSTYKEPEHFLRSAIESILKQTYTDFEFIIILDNPDNMLHKNIINGYALNDQRIQFYVNEKNLGLTKSLNKGLKYAQRKYIARMDADDISSEDRFEKQIRYLRDNDLDLIGGNTQIINEDGESLYSIKKIPTNEQVIKKVIRYNQCIAHPTWLAKRDLFIKLNGYREMPLCEDYDFTLRAILAGYRVSNINDTVLKYRMTSQSISRNNLLRQYLYMEYITREYRHGKVAQIIDAHTYVDYKFSEVKSERYKKANVIFNKALNNIEKKQLFGFFVNGVKLVFTSFTFLKKTYRLIRVSLNH
ncbi:glycosyltransferase involved in cell wall biosynthesis [Breznakia sp. PF5-3]|uniref:glycosyltransferase n=1 Tax=unclassified Breznakia TaxID=2623764 RepID=UPI002407377C|nr:MULTISPECIES: glycosyltransferase [unclassified Breznakia]MDF9824986.1 glycosyltransferase involved in cell wall biosynthesis [Breznakia sp. PM6-1]MDF9835821.1 glycosyltransferase involved in cell wall biosynthesis [Breznakia sp. PF5-3]MDF9836927.1 glycosyltransferase involved in cell wall biosynthesis [Breznakia sp. PFB2-8]MDF9859873.1 glycosyltransferase involved in cell wall biosynthesis [Breznakia sp. PH5-24]